MRRETVLCLALAVLVGLGAGSILSQLTSTADSVHAQGSWTARKFYLSKTPVQGNRALTACAAGYHMASMWEVFNVSTLQYDTVNGAMADDSGSGPPTNPNPPPVTDYGWIRTGAGASNQSSPNPGVANCNVWRSNAGDVKGSAVRLLPRWDYAGAQLAIVPWQVMMDPGTKEGPACGYPLSVWCVQN